jgi:hypothetical protein
MSDGLSEAQVEEFKKWLGEQHDEMIRRGDRCDRDEFPLQTRTWWGKGSAYLICLKMLASLESKPLDAPQSKPSGKEESKPE